MKKIVTLICILSIVLTSAVCSVSAAEAKNIEKAVQTETTTEELKNAPESEATETAPKAATVPTVKETDEAKIVEPKQERVTDSSYYGSFWGEPETYIEIAPEDRKTLEDLPADVQEYFAQREAERKKANQEKVKKYYEENPRPRWSVNFKSNTEKYITSEVYKKAEAMIIAEIAASEKLGIDEVPLYVNSEGKVISEMKIALPKEVIFKLAAHYYEAYDLYQKATGGEIMYMFQDLVMFSHQYDEVDGVWLCFFCTDKEKYPDREGACLTVVVKDNGEFVGLG